MQFLLCLTILLFGTHEIAAICYPNTVCTEDRDTITQLDASVVPEERHETGMKSRAWYIQPDTDTMFNVILAFKNYSSSDDVAVMMISYLNKNESKTDVLRSRKGDFELVVENTIGVVIFVPLYENRSTNFVLNYYSKCEILTAPQDQISYFDPLRVPFTQKACWYVKPTDYEERKRFYFSIRDVNLNMGQQLAIWDVHTTNLIANASRDASDVTIAAQPSTYATIMIDLICTKNVCRDDSNSFVVSYYAMTQTDLDCQLTQRECFERKYEPDLTCNGTCPAFDNMILEEYGLQANGNLTPIIRSGGQRPRNQQENAATQSCPWGVKNCRCLHSPNPQRFCGERLKCVKNRAVARADCVFACIYHKMTTCIRLKILQSIVLL